MRIITTTTITSIAYHMMNPSRCAGRISAPARHRFQRLLVPSPIAPVRSFATATKSPGSGDNNNNDGDGGGAGSRNKAPDDDATVTDPRLSDLGRRIHDDYANIKEHYATPKHPIVLAHGLLGFAELSLTPGWLGLPPVHYWRGIAEALQRNGVRVITTTVPPSGSIEQRAEELARGIAEAVASSSSSHTSSSSPSSSEDKVHEVNLVGHSMGGLDARYMIAHDLLRKHGTGVRVRSLVTVASPHRGSAFADYLLRGIGDAHLPELKGLLGRFGVQRLGAFEQLTSEYMDRHFNPRTPDHPDVRYFSYGATTERPPLLSPFRQSHNIITRVEGPNDGLVSVGSARWGSYKGTLVNVSHLDLINWTNRWRWMLRSLVGITPGFNAIAFYLGIADMLAKEGL